MRRDSLVTPELYPITLDLDRERVLLVRLEEAGYRAASFLDERILRQVGPGDWIDWDDLLQVLPPPERECDFIFHIGHVGSSLISRLLDNSSRVFGLREPAILRTLAWAALDGLGGAILEEKTSAFLRLWSRVWRPTQKSLLKATSFTAEISPLLMRLQRSARAILMFVRPEIYVATILASDPSRAETKFNASRRLGRLHRRLSVQAWRLDAMSEGEVVAMSWVTEMLSLITLAEDCPGRGLWLDFETFLERPAERLADCLRHLHDEAPAADIAAMIESPDLGRYSKAPEHAYDAALRRQVLSQSEREHPAEIRRAMHWLEAAAGAHGPLAKALTFAAAR